MSRPDPNRILIDCAKLRNEIAQRKLTLSQVDREMGCSNGYLSNKLRGDQNYITRRDAMLLEFIYHIQPCDIRVEDKVEEPDPVVKEVEEHQPSAPAELDYDKLYHVVYTAMFQALQNYYSGASAEQEKK